MLTMGSPPPAQPNPTSHPKNTPGCPIAAAQCPHGDGHVPSHLQSSWKS